MSRKLWTVLIMCLAVSLSLASTTPDEIPLPEKWDTFFVLFLMTNPEFSWASEEEQKSVTAAHIQFQLRLQKEGRAIAAGGLGQGANSSIVGLTILRADNLAKAQAIADGDPAVVAGRFIASVREWWVPAGRLP
jgi:uncharacterized protein YciI